MSEARGDQRDTGPISIPILDRDDEEDDDREGITKRLVTDGPYICTYNKYIIQYFEG